MNVYLWVGLASAALVLVSVFASLRKYFAGLSLGSLILGNLAGIILGRFRRGWKTRRSITITMDGDTLNLRNITSQQQQQLIELWLSRHPDGDAK
jgi:hypothetical protein